MVHQYIIFLTIFLGIFRLWKSGHFTNLDSRRLCGNQCNGGYSSDNVRRELESGPRCSGRMSNLSNRTTETVLYLSTGCWWLHGKVTYFFRLFKKKSDKISNKSNFPTKPDFSKTLQGNLWATSGKDITIEANCWWKGHWASFRQLKSSPHDFQRSN